MEKNVNAAFAAIEQYLDLVETSIGQMRQALLSGRLTTVRDMSVLTQAQVRLIECYSDQMVRDNYDWSMVTESNINA